MAFRPKTLAASVTPVMIGTAMAFGDGLGHTGYAVLCLLTALSVQIGTNIANDYFDFIKGADTSERIGPTRVTQAGLIKPNTVRLGFIFAFTITALCCAFLVVRGGWPFAVLGVLSIVSGILYTGGPKPLGYIGLGDIFVLIFFGPVAVAGTYYVQTLELNTAVVASGLGPGFISCAILAVNNMRDIESDRKTGKKTLAVRFGREFAQHEYYICLVSAALLPVFIYAMIDDHMPVMWASIILFPAASVLHTVFTKTDGPALNDALAQTGKILFIYSVIYSIGWIL